MTAVKNSKPVVRGPGKVHRQSQGEKYAECSVHWTGGSVTSTAVLGFTLDWPASLRHESRQYVELTPAIYDLGIKRHERESL